MTDTSKFSLKIFPRGIEDFPHPRVHPLPALAGLHAACLQPWTSFITVR